MRRNPKMARKALPPIELLLILVLSIMVLACGGEPSGESTKDESVSTNTPRPTYTSYPTYTPYPTHTLAPTDTPAPTNTPHSTDTPTLAYTPTPERIIGQVLRVIDGDTIEVVIDGQVYKLRYIGIDTPETVAPGQPVEWMGKEAYEANRALVEGKTVYLEKDISETDRYGRLLRYVFLDDGTFVNAELVRLGYAQVSTYPPDVKYQDLFLQMQQEARGAKRGLWGPTPTFTHTPTVVPTDTSTVLPTLTPSPTLRPATATPLPPTPTLLPPTEPPPTQPPAPAPTGNVVISRIFYDGAVPRVESDEYAEITNRGGAPVNLAGWRLNAGDPGQDFFFPDFILQPSQSCRVYTNEYHAESCGFSFGSGRAIWNNKGDCGHLYDATGAEVSQYCY